MLKITPSSKISLLATKSIYDLVAGTVYVDLSASKFIGSGATAVLNATLVVKDPGGVTIGTTSILPPMTSGITINLPKIGGKYKLGDYKIIATLFDGINSYTDTTLFNLCKQPEDGIVISAETKCDSGELRISFDSLPKYKKAQAFSYTEAWDVLVPESDSPHLYNQSPFSEAIIEGINTISAAITAEYKFPESVTVKMALTGTLDKKVRCFVDLCHIYGPLHELRLEADDATGSYKEELDAKVTGAFRLLSLAKIGEDTGCGTGDIMDALEEILGIDYCAPKYNQIPQGPLESTYISGCGVTSITEGAIETFTVNNYQYSISLIDAKGWVKVINTNNGCIKTINFDFDDSKLAEALLERFEGEDNSRFIGIFKTAFDNINPQCLDTVAAWKAKQWKAQLQVWLEKICTCCNQGAVQVVLHCTYASIDTDFISGDAATGTITIPVTVTGAGSVTITISTYGITGTLTQVVDEGTTEITISVTYDGSSTGNDGIEILIPATFSASDVFQIFLYGNNLPADFITIDGTDLDGSNIYRNDLILGRTVLVFYNGINRYLLRDVADLTYPTSEWNYVPIEAVETCRDAEVIVTWDGGSDNCSICIPVTTE